MSASEIRTLYRSMGTGELEDLRAAFKADRANLVRQQDFDHVGRPQSIAFCDGCLKLIDAELARRSATQ